jgi:tetratricopeptide (TPR) repeat protein
MNKQPNKSDGPVQQIIAKANSQIKNVSQTIIQFDPREMRIGFALLTIISIVSLGGIYAVYINLSATGTQPPARMSGDFRVAIAAFGVHGDHADRDLGISVGNSVFLSVESILSELLHGLTEEVWGPAQVGTLEGDTKEERALAAQQLAEEIAADIIVYGVIDATQPNWQVTPEFYVSGLSFTDALELVGQYDFGEAILVTGFSGDGGPRINLNRRLAPRIELLSNLMIGLAHYATRDFEQALIEFEKIDKGNIWADNIGGRQVLYLLLGNVSGRLGDLEDAEQYYLQALEHDPEYSRAYAGLGNVYFIYALERAGELEDLSEIDVALLDKSVNYYKKAQAALNKPVMSDMDIKVHFGLGQAYLMRSYTSSDIIVAPAIPEFEAVIAAHDEGNLRVRELAAHAHVRLAAIYAAGNMLEEAYLHYEAGIDIYQQIGDQENISFYQEQLHHLSGALGD